MPKNVVQGQQKPKNRKFHEEWEDLYLVSDNNGKAICLICRNIFTQNKKYVFERHFNTNHSEFNEKYPLSSKERAVQILKLKSEIEPEQKIVEQNGKPYSDGEFYKKLMQSTVEILCQNLDEKQKAQLLDKIKLLPVSHQTIGRRVIDIVAEVEANLKRDLTKQQILKTCHNFCFGCDMLLMNESKKMFLHWWYLKSEHEVWMSSMRF